MERKTRSETVVLGIMVNALVQDGKTYKEIAKTLNLKSPQLARYHFLRYRRKNEKVDKIKQT